MNEICRKYILTRRTSELKYKLLQLRNFENENHFWDHSFFKIGT